MKVADMDIKFVPEFGNDTHIQILELVNDINEDYASLQRKQVAAQGSKALEEKIGKKVEQLNKMLAGQKQK